MRSVINQPSKFPQGSEPRKGGRTRASLGLVPQVREGTYPTANTYGGPAPRQALAGLGAEDAMLNNTDQEPSCSIWGDSTVMQVKHSVCEMVTNGMGGKRKRGNRKFREWQFRIGESEEGVFEKNTGKGGKCCVISWKRTFWAGPWVSAKALRRVCA